jgi:hypothetical protein
LRRLQKDPGDLFDVIIFMSNSGGELPASAEDQIIPSRFPSIAELRDFSAPLGEKQDRQRRVIFFGTPFLLVKNLAPEVYVEHLDRCLDYIRQNYPGRDLIYRPHPFEKGEADKISLEGFRIEDDREVADLYFLRHFAGIEAVYSVSSTVSRTALNNGLNSYALWRCFPFSETQMKFFQGVMGIVPSEFEISDLTKLPVAYQDRQSPVGDATSFSQALKRAMDLREKISSAL